MYWRLLSIGAALLFMAPTTFAACSGSDSGPSTDSETHWMETCEQDSDCPADLSCLCDTCTATCDDTCDDVADAATCLPAPTGCGLAGEPVCLVECTGDEACEEGYECAQGGCVLEDLHGYDGPFCDGIEAWECSTLDEGPSLITDRRSPDVVVLDDRHVLIFGGTLAPNEGETFGDRIVTSVEIIDVTTDEIREVGSFDPGTIRHAIHVGADGSVLFFGGEVFEAEERQPVYTVKRFEPDTESWSTLESTLSTHNPRAIELSNGDILFVGGEDDEDTVRHTVDRYDPDTRTLTSAAPTHQPHRFPDVTLLDDGRVLVLHGYNDSDVQGEEEDEEEGRIEGEIYDPTADEWTAIASLQLNTRLDRRGLVAEELPDGKVLVLFAHKELDEGVDTPMTATSWAWLNQVTAATYDRTDDRWEELEVFDHTYGGMRPGITRLFDQETYLINLYGDAEDWTPGYIFDPEGSTWDFRYERRPIPGYVVTVLPGDRVLFDSRSAPQHAQIYDTKADSWTNFDAIPDGLYYSTMTLLPDCRLMLVDERGRSGVVTEKTGLETAYCTPE